MKAFKLSIFCPNLTQFAGSSNRKSIWKVRQRNFTEIKKKHILKVKSCNKMMNLKERQRGSRESVLASVLSYDKREIPLFIFAPSGQNRRKSSL